MKLAVFLLCLFALAYCAPVYDMRLPTEALFTQYIEDYDVTFESLEHRIERYAVFTKNVEIINQKNKQYPQTKFGLNKFALLSPKEFKDQYLSDVVAVRPANAPVAAEVGDDVVDAIPEKFDWRKNAKQVVTPVKNQGACGSCWSFSTTGNIEGQWALAGNGLTSLSEQNLVDCDHHCMQYENQQACDAGCNGGLPPNAYEYIIGNGGVDTEASYPYQGVDGSCKFNAKTVGAKISNWTFVSKDEKQMAAYLVQNGPLSVAVDAVEWQFYIGGVWYLPCGTSLDHAVLIVGYDSETDIFFQTMPYWIVKNSWGADWGESGYIYVERGNGRCGINLYASSAIV